MIHLEIGPVCLSIDGLSPHEVPQNTLLFQTTEQAADIRYQVKMGVPLPSFPETILFRHKDIVVFKKENKLESRLLFLPGVSMPYAYYDENDEENITIYYHPQFRDLLNTDTIFHSLLALERHLYKREYFILHSAFLHYKNQAILFSGPSGIGKSTHADLWCRYKGADVVNGDRSLLYLNEQGVYEAGGWPVCGSSQICRNEHYPLSALVFMEQSPENEIRETREMNLYKRLCSQITINWWNPDYVRKAQDWLLSFLEHVGVCVYACNREATAPQTLYEFLKQKRWINDETNQGIY